MARHFAESGEKVIIINRDSIRKMLFGSESAFGIDEDLVSNVEHATLVFALREGYDVVIDNTNTEWQYVIKSAQVGAAHSADIEIHVIEMPLDIALKRNAMRDRVVPDDVIRKQYKRLNETKDWTL